MRRPSGLPVLTAAALALALAGCSADPTTPSDAPTTDLAAFFEELGASWEGEDYERQQREVEELVAACMTEEGFEYTPADPVGTAGSDDVPDWGTEEFAEQYGYGATTMDDAYSTGEEQVDPNADYVAAMSESEQAAYLEALWGATPELDPDADPDAAVEYEMGGCYGEAQDAVFSAQDIWEDPTLEAFFDEMQSAYEDLPSTDAALGEAVATWSECMADAGYDFATPDEAANSIHEEATALWEAVPVPDPDAEPDPEATYGPDEAAMAELREKEMTLAPVDYGCRDSSGYTEAFETASRGVEERLWEKYGDQLEAATATPSE